MGRVFPAYGTPLTVVSLFQYLLQTLLSTDNDRTAVERNLRSLPSQYLRQTDPISPLPPEVPFHCRPIIFSGQQFL